MKASDYLRLSEKIHQNEVRVKDEIESVISDIHYNESMLASCHSEIDMLRTQLYKEETYYDSEGNPYTKTVEDSTVRSEITALQIRAAGISSTIGTLKVRKAGLKVELAGIQVEKSSTLREIEQVADVKKRNFSKTANMTSDYLSVAADLQSAFKHNHDELSVAASLLDGNIGGLGFYGSGGMGSGGYIRNLNSPRVGGVGRRIARNPVVFSKPQFRKSMPITVPPVAGSPVAVAPVQSAVSAAVNPSKAPIAPTLQRFAPIQVSKTIISPKKQSTKKSKKASAPLPPSQNLTQVAAVQQNITPAPRAKAKSESDKMLEKRTPPKSEEKSMEFASGYINGNQFHFIKVLKKNIPTLIHIKQNIKGTQKPDKYKLDADRKILFIIEDKNYRIEKTNNYNNLINNIAKQAVNRINNCLDADVPANLMGNSEDTHIDKLVLTFCVDVMGHYKHDDGTYVGISEHATMVKRVKEKVVEMVGNPDILKNVHLRIATLFNDFTSKPIDVSKYSEDSLFPEK